MATYGSDEKGQPLKSTRKLVKSIFHQEVPAIRSVLLPLESSMRESLKFHVAETLLSYVELAHSAKQVPSYPKRLRMQDKEPQRITTLMQLQTIGDDLKEETRLISLLQQAQPGAMESLSFLRIDPNRNCGLFFNAQTQRFYARLFIVSPKACHAHPLSIAGHYIDLRSKKVYARHADDTDGIESFGGAKGSIMVALEMGRWHESPLRFTSAAFLPQRLETGEAAIPVSAKLVKAKESYQLHVAFRFPKPQRLQSLTLLGVDRGITRLAAGAVVSLDGKHILETFEADGLQLKALQMRWEEYIKKRQAKGNITKGDRKRGRIADQHVHLCANQIVELAIKHQSHVIMEDLDAFAIPKKRAKGQQRGIFNRMLSRRQYQKLQTMVDRKLTLVGLPPIRRVPASFTSLTCSKCGHISVENRSKEDRNIFLCVNCKQQTHVSRQAGINIARKTHWLAVRSQEKQQEVPVSERTTWAAFVKKFCATP